MRNENLRPFTFPVEEFPPRERGIYQRGGKAQMVILPGSWLLAEVQISLCRGRLGRVGRVRGRGADGGQTGVKRPLRRGSDGSKWLGLSGSTCFGRFGWMFFIFFLRRRPRITRISRIFSRGGDPTRTGQPPRGAKDSGVVPAFSGFVRADSGLFRVVSGQFRVHSGFIPGLICWSCNGF